MTAKIYGLMPKIAAEIGAIGKNKQAQGFKFRGIDDVYNALSAPLCHHGVFMTSEVLEMTREERLSQAQKTLIYSVVKLKVTFWADDGSSVCTVLMGEAFDSGDKSLSKAMSIALKYIAFQTFCIPIEEVVDAEPERYDVARRDDRRPVDPPPKIEAPKPQTSVAFQTFASLIKNLCEAGGKESTKEQRKALAGAAAETIGLTFEMLTNADAGTLEKVYAEAERMINGVPTEKGIATADVPY